MLPPALRISDCEKLRREILSSARVDEGEMVMLWKATERWMERSVPVHAVPVMQLLAEGSTLSSTLYTSLLEQALVTETLARVKESWRKVVEPEDC